MLYFPGDSTIGADSAEIMATPPIRFPDDARALKELLIAARDENERLIAIIKVLQR